jgi:hypothetical protein
MRPDVFHPPGDRTVPPRRFAERRDHLIHAITHDRPAARGRSALPTLPRRRGLLAAAAAVVALAAVGSAVGFGVNLLTQQEQLHQQISSFDPHSPKPIGSSVEVASGSTWALVAWKTAEGICLDYAVLGRAVSGCGFPVPGAIAADHSQGPLHEVAAVVASSGLSSEGRAAIAGIAASDVSSVQIELADGQILPAETYDAPEALAANVRFFLLRLPISASLNGQDVSFARALLAYGANDRLLERFVLSHGGA